MLKRVLNLSLLGGLVATFATIAGTAQAAVEGETAYVFNTFSFLVHGFLVMWMAAGFAMLESGLVRSKNTAAICLKNIALYSIAGIMYYLIGYNLMYTDVPEGGWLGTFSFLYNPSDAELALLAAEDKTDKMISLSSTMDIQSVLIGSSRWSSSLRRRPLSPALWRSVLKSGLS